MVKKLSDLYLDARKAFLETEDNQTASLMARNLLYTAVTRAKKMVILVGRSDIPRKMTENNRHVLRFTSLKDKICDYI